MSSDFNPDVSKLFRRPEIRKPQEEFELPPPGADDLPLPAITELPEPRELLDELLDEAARVQELIDLLTETVDGEVELHPDEHDQYGTHSLTAKQYRDSIGDDTKKRHRKRYEHGILDQGGCGGALFGGLNWALLALPDLFGIRDTLLQAANMLEGTLLFQVEGQMAREAQAKEEQQRRQEAWKEQQQGSHLAGVYGDMVKGSAAYRNTFARTVATAYRDLKGPMLNCLFQQAFVQKIQEAQKNLHEICDLLKRIRTLLCHLMLLRMLAFKDVREALESLIKGLLIGQLIQTIGGLLSQIIAAVVSPVTEFLATRFSDDCFVAAIGDEVGQLLIGAMGEAVVAIHHQYTGLLADLYRANQKEMQARLAGLSALADRNTIGRWIVHLDQAINLCETILAAPGVDQGLLRTFLDQKLDPPVHKLLDRLNDHPHYGPLMDAPLPMQTPLGDPRLA